MKIQTRYLLAIITFTTYGSYGQPDYPSLSFPSTLRQTVGFTNFEIRYERPLQRGRTIFGALVP